MKKFLLIGFAGLALMSGCALSSLQSANTVRPGDASIFVAGTGLYIDGVSMFGSMYDVGVRFGLSENMDLGLRPFGLGLYGDLKYAFFQSRKFGPSLALDGGLGYMKIAEVGFYALDFGPIFSFKLGRFLNPYISARYRKMGLTLAGATTGDVFGDMTGDFITGNLGFELFPDSKVSLIFEGMQFFSVQGDPVADGYFIWNIGLKLNI